MSLLRAHGADQFRHADAHPRGQQYEEHNSAGLVGGLTPYRAKEWGAQLKRCEDDLDSGWWIF